MMLDFHNAERRCYGAQPLSWDNALEMSARVYGAQCRWGHDPNRNGQGENLAAGSGSSQDALTLVNGWLDEQFSWNCGTNRCNAGEVCGHYTGACGKLTINCPGH